MAKGYYGTYTSVKDTIVIEVQKKYEYGCDIATAICTRTKFDLVALEPGTGGALSLLRLETS